MAAMTGGHGRIVWMPTVDAAQGPFAATVEAANILPVSANGELLPEVIAVLETIASLDLALATGHSSPQDSLLLVRAARDLGIDRIVITHPLGDLSLPPAHSTGADRARRVARVSVRDDRADRRHVTSMSSSRAYEPPARSTSCSARISDSPAIPCRRWALPAAFNACSMPVLRSARSTYDSAQPGTASGPRP